MLWTVFAMHCWLFNLHLEVGLLRPQIQFVALHLVRPDDLISLAAFKLTVALLSVILCIHTISVINNENSLISSNLSLRVVTRLLLYELFA